MKMQVDFVPEQSYRRTTKHLKLPPIERIVIFEIPGHAEQQLLRDQGIDFNTNNNSGLYSAGGEEIE